MKISENLLDRLSVLSVCGLLWIWVIPNTIALRHGLLALGSIAGGLIISKNWKKLFSMRLSLIPLYAIGALFIWVLIHYFFFSLNRDLELSEIKGLWLRALVGCLLAMGFSLSISRQIELRKYFYVSIFAVPFINLVTYFYDCYLFGRLIRPDEFVRFYFTKIETAYFGGIAVAISVASVISLLSKSDVRRHSLLIFLFLAGIALVLLSDLLSNTKNGIAIAIGLCILLAIVIVIKTLFSFKNSKKIAVTLLIFISLLVGSVWQGHKLFAFKGWDTVFEDVKVAIEIDIHQQWKYREGTVEAPLNSAGTPAALNTYVRFAYIAVGIRLIDLYPFGYGSINRSFNEMQDYANIYHEHTGQVHSGWIDFGLAFGLPGLFFIFLSLIGVIVVGVRQERSLSLIAVFIAIMLIPFGMIAEISYKQYFEATLFFMTFAATTVALNITSSHKT